MIYFILNLIPSFSSIEIYCSFVITLSLLAIDVVNVFTVKGYSKNKFPNLNRLFDLTQIKQTVILKRDLTPKNAHM